MAKTFIYSDLNEQFLKHPNSLDVVRRFDEDAIKGAIRNILRTRKGEKLFNPLFGSDVENILFELITPFTRIMASKLLKQELERWEPRITVTNVVVDDQPDFMGGVNITIAFVINEKPNQIIQVTVKLERIR
jgi:phage baseplate assembly protein W